MTTRTPSGSAAAWWAAFPLGFVLLMQGTRIDGAPGITLLAGAVTLFVVATAAVAAAGHTGNVGSGPSATRQVAA